MDLKLLWYGLKWGFGFGKAEPINFIFKRNRQVQIWAGDKKEIRFGTGDDGFPIEAKRPNTPKHFLSDGRPVHVFVEGKPEAVGMSVDVLEENKPTYEDVELRNMMASSLYFNRALEMLYEMPKKFNINWKLVALLIGVAVLGLIAWYFMGGYEMLAGFVGADALAPSGTNMLVPNKPI